MSNRFLIPIATLSVTLLLTLPDPLSADTRPLLPGAPANVLAPHHAGPSSHAAQTPAAHHPPAASSWHTVRLRPSLTLRYTRGERLLSEWLIRPIDGDTFAYGSERIRIQGVNAPELADSGGFEAAQRLASLLHDGAVRIVPKAIDKYGRTVAEVFVDDRNVATTLKREGYAP